ncbi:TPA: hypothetical protein R8F97_001035 [Pseudomonas putida]|nr:hypothetical protein [Pseudomonas putida]
MPYNTRNPVGPSGSNDPRDLFDNSGIADVWTTDRDKMSHPDRMGVPRKTWAGMEYGFEVAQADRKIQFDQFLASSGYETPVPYQEGIFVERYTQLIEYNGELYRAKTGVLPVILTGDWSSDAPKLVAVGDAALRQDLGNSPGSRIVGYLLDALSSIQRDVGGKLDELPSVKDFGPAGTGNGVTSDHLAAIAMGQELGYIRFSRGNYVLDTCQLDWPIIYDKKANTKVNSGQVVTITQAVSSPKQYIFKGDGLYNLTQIDTGSGEDVRNVHLSWFGAFPSVVKIGDMGPPIAKLFASMGNARESVAHADIGGYTISSNVQITRGGHLKGAGSRRTVFKFDGDGYIGFTDTVAGLAKISDCNFELVPGTVNNRLMPFVEFNGNESEFYNIRLGETAKGFVVSGNSSHVYNIAAAYGSNKGAGSDLIHVKGGNGHRIHDINLATSSAFGPEMIVRVGGEGSLGINYVNISNIYHMTPSITVGVRPASESISGVFIDGLQYNGFTGTPPAQMVLLETSGAASLDNVNIGRVQGSSRSIAMVTAKQGSTGSMRRIIIDGVQDKRTDGNGIELIQTAGVLDDVDIKSGVQLKTRTNPVFRSGTLGEIRVAAGVEHDSSQVLGRKSSIPNDGVYQINLGKSVFSALVNIAANASSTMNYGQYAVRAAASPSVLAISQTSTMATALTALTGTTGGEGKITLGVTNGVLYIQNRSGAAINVAVSITGV